MHRASTSTRPPGGALALPPRPRLANTPLPRRLVHAVAAAAQDEGDAFFEGDDDAGAGASDGSPPPPARRAPAPRSRLEAKQSTRLRSQLRAMLPDPVDDPLFDAGMRGVGVREKHTHKFAAAGRPNLWQRACFSFFSSEQSVRRPGAPCGFHDPHTTTRPGAVTLSAEETRGSISTPPAPAWPGCEAVGRARRSGGGGGPGGNWAPPPPPPPPGGCPTLVSAPGRVFFFFLHKRGHVRSPDSRHLGL